MDVSSVQSDRVQSRTAHSASLMTPYFPHSAAPVFPALFFSRFFSFFARRSFLSRLRSFRSRSFLSLLESFLLESSDRSESEPESDPEPERELDLDLRLLELDDLCREEDDLW